MRKDDIVRMCTKHSKDYERRLDAERKRAVDFAVRMEQQNAEIREQMRQLSEEIGELEDQLGKLTRQNEQLRNALEMARWRCYCILRSTDQDAEIFGLPKYQIASVEEIMKQDEILTDETHNWIQEMQKKYNITARAYGSELNEGA